MKGMDEYIFACYECGEDLKIELENTSKLKDSTYYEGDSYSDLRKIQKFDKKEITCPRCNLDLIIDLDSTPVYWLSVEVKDS